jgi:hypoxanthine-DNA glycosylase
VVRTARRSGSLDTAIRDAEAHPLAELATSLPDLRAIAFNGAKAASLGMRQFAPDESRWRLVILPSSSPAHAIGFERKLQAWLALRDFL